jgi:methylated-DNA-[protein]-cysteine S-methyltransferase
MAKYGFTVFETAIGWCAVAWGDGGLVGVRLPEADREKARARMRRRFPEAGEAMPPPHARDAISGIIALLAGEPADLSAIRIDMKDVPEFHRRVYDVARTIAPGATLTYGDIAARLGDASAARDVGEALGKNPFPIVVPCHRVVAAGGKLGGFSAPGGGKTKLRLLAIESAHQRGALPLFELSPRPE